MLTQKFFIRNSTPEQKQVNCSTQSNELINGTDVTVIELVILAKKYYKEHPGGVGMCWAVNEALYELVPNAACLRLTGYSHYDWQGNIQPIPKFTQEIAIEKFGASNRKYYWWDIDDKKIRIKYFDWLIEEYSK